MRGDRGNLSNPAVALRDIIRGEIRKGGKEQDQVMLGVVTDTGVGFGLGGDIEVQLDGFGAGPLPATWSAPDQPSVGQRVVLVALTGGQKWFVVGVAGGPQVVRQTHSQSYGGSTSRINDFEQVEIAMLFDVPSAWNSWDVQISSSWAVFEDLAATGNTFMRFRIRKTSVSGDVWGRTFQTLPAASPNDESMALVAHAEDQTDTGSVTFVWTAEAGSNQNIFAWDDFELILQAWRVT